MEKHYCINCGAEATMLHHVVPKKLGGNDTTNCVWLCDKCHGLIYGIKYGNGQLSQNELVKQGLARARAEGKDRDDHQQKSLKIILKILLLGNVEKLLLQKQLNVQILQRQLFTN